MTSMFCSAIFARTAFHRRSRSAKEKRGYGYSSAIFSLSFNERVIFHHEGTKSTKLAKSLVRNLRVLRGEGIVWLNCRRSSVRFSARAHASDRGLEQPLGFVRQVFGRPIFFVHAKAFVVGADGVFAPLIIGNVRTMDFEMIAVEIIKVNLCTFSAGSGHRADERYLPF